MLFCLMILWGKVGKGRVEKNEGGWAVGRVGGEGVERNRVENKERYEDLN